jgi:hypothetical protein
MQPINRSAVIITAKQAFFDKIAELSGEEAMKENELNEKMDASTVYLIPNDIPDQDSFWDYLKRNYIPILLAEFESWYNLSQDWTKRVTFKEFKSWFTISYQSMIFDILENGLEHEDY